MGVRSIAILLSAVIGIAGIVWLFGSPSTADLSHAANKAITATTVPNFPNDAYVWQRSWTPDVVNSIQTEHTSFRRLVILAGEISLRDNSVVAVSPRWKDIAASVNDVGAVIRIGPLPAAKAAEAFNENSPQVMLIIRSATAALADAQAAGMRISELQIDFDCAESKLAGYQKWVAAIQRAVVPLPVVITALPSWLKHHEFMALAQQAGGFILQVHSLHRPTSPSDSMVLCDAVEASRAITDASAAGVPFRVAFPTYSYLAGFSADGKFLGLAGEGARPAWPEDAIVKTMQSDPAAIATLVHDLDQHHPALLTGIIWYRLPVANDSLNWRMATLKAVIAGREPQPKLNAIAIKSSSGTADVFLQNPGEADAIISAPITVEWAHGDLIAADGINSFDRLDSGPGRVTFRPVASAREQRIAPGDRLQIGWLRLSTDTEVQTHVDPPSTLPAN